MIDIYNSNNNLFSNSLNNKGSLLKYGINQTALTLNTLINKQQNRLNYKLLNTQNKFLSLQIKDIENQALEQMNNVRDNFISAIGNLQYQAVRSGIKSNSGNIKNNIELSSKNLSEDENILKRKVDNTKRQLSFQQ